MLYVFVEIVDSECERFYPFEIVKKLSKISIKVVLSDQHKILAFVIVAHRTKLD